MPEHAVRQRRVEEAHERVRRGVVPERPAPGPTAREERAETQEVLVGGPYVALPRARGPDGGDEAKLLLDTLRESGLIFGPYGYGIRTCEP